MIRQLSRLSLSFLFALILAISLSHSLARAAYSDPAEIKGRITDETGQPVRGAMVNLVTRDGRQLSTTTDEEGVYKFINLKTDSYLIKADAQGFRTLVSDEITLTSGESEAVDLTLQVTGINEEVVITASSTLQTVDETSKPLTVVTRKEILDRQENAIGETLRNEPGVRVRTFGGPGNLASIRLRGLANENTAILIDGLRLRDAGDNRGSSLSLNDSLFVDNVERIEILRGSGSSLYGTTAVGGAINIVPVTGAGRPSGEISFEGGGLGFFREAARVSGSLRNQFSYSLGASRIDTNDGIDGNDIYRTTNIGSSLRYTPTSGFSLSGLINYSRSFLQVNDSPFPIGPAGNEFGYLNGFIPGSGFSVPVVGFMPDFDDPDSFRTIRFLQTGIAARHRLNEIVSYYATFNYVRSNRRFIDGPAAAPQLIDLITKAQGFFPSFSSDSRFQGRTYTFNSGVNLRLGSHHLVTVGFEAERERLRQTTDFFGKESFAQSTYGFYFQEQARYFENRLQLSAAGRVQSFTLDIPDSLAGIPANDLSQLQDKGVPRAYTGDGSIAYSFFNTGTKLRAHVGNSFRAPALFERFDAFNGSFMPVRIGNPFLRPERAISVDAGIDQSAFNNRLKMSLSYFYTRRQEIIIAGFIPFSPSTGSAFFETNAPGGLSRGFEAAVAINPIRDLDINFSYLYTNSEFRFNGVRSTGESISGSTDFLGTPRHTFNMIVNKRYKNLNINFDLNYNSEHQNLVFTPPELFTGFAALIFRFEGYVKADLSGSYTFRLNDKTSLELFGKAANIGDKKFFEDGFRNPGIVGTGGVRIRF